MSYHIKLRWTFSWFSFNLFDIIILSFRIFINQTKLGDKMNKLNYTNSVWLGSIFFA